MARFLSWVMPMFGNPLDYLREQLAHSALQMTAPEFLLFWLAKVALPLSVTTHFSTWSLDGGVPRLGDILGVRNHR